MPAANYQLFVVDLRAIPQNNEAFSVSGFLDPINASNRYQRASMDADEIIAELLGKCFQ